VETGLYAPRSVQRLGPDRLAMLATSPQDRSGLVVELQGGKLTRVAGGGSPTQAGDVEGPALGATITAVDSSLVEHEGTFYYAFAAAGFIQRFRPGGNVENWGGYGADTVGGVDVKGMNFYRIRCMEKGPDGLIYVGTPFYIYTIDPETGIANILAGAQSGAPGNGQPARASKLEGPTAFAWDAAGNLYFSEPARSRVRRIRKDTGVVEAVAGAGTGNLDGATIETGLGLPSGLAFDKAGNLYVADVSHGQIKTVAKDRLPE
jgi:sugar lactone lactonase YvrE